MLFLYFLVLIAASDLTFASQGNGPRGQHPHLVKHGMFPAGVPKHSRPHRREALVGRGKASQSTACGSGGHLNTKAPRANIFAGLIDDDAAAVTAFLHRQKTLNLTAAVNATSWDNKIVQVELLQPNKSDALAYLDSGAAAPKRYARAVVRFGAPLKPYIQEFQVGPLPVVDGSTTLVPLNYIYNKGRGYQRLYDGEQGALAAFTIGIGTRMADVTQSLLHGTATGTANDTLAVAGSNPLVHEGEKTFQWYQFYSLHTGPCFDEDLLPSGLIFKADITGRDPSKWSVVAWHYNGIHYESEAKFRQAMNSSSFVRPGPNVDGPWACTDYNGDPFPNDELSPPVPVQPDGPRFAVDEQEKYVEWSTLEWFSDKSSGVPKLTVAKVDFSFYLSSNRDLGMQLHNVAYKGERIIYEVGIQEAIAHYASASDPYQASVAYLDSEFGFGQFTFQLVSGFDCPAYAAYLNTSYYTGETSHTHPSSICLFEIDAGYPMQRHTTPTYVSTTKNIAFVVRSIATIGNYDYLFDYEFHLDGSIQISVRASGYIQASFWASTTTGRDGFHIHDNLAGAMHEHVLNYKLDLDVAGTANSLVKGTLVPTTEIYPWSNGKPINSMKFDRTFITSEDQGKLNWDGNNAVTYSVVNKDARNKYGEYRGWKITPGTSNRNSLVIQNSSSLGKSVNWATHHLYAVRRKDSEPHSSYPYNGWDSNDPVVDFNKFFDGESLDQEDIVIYFNLGMHHVPDTSDLPNTVYTSSHSSMTISPQNYLLGDASRGTIHQTRVNVMDGAVTGALTFGVTQPTCSLDMSITAPNLQSFVGEVYIDKYIYFPGMKMIGDPGFGIQAGIP